MRVLPGAFQTKPGAALARGQGWLPWQGRGWFPAPCLGRHPGVRELPISHLAPGLAGSAVSGLLRHQSVQQPRELEREEELRGWACSERLQGVEVLERHRLLVDVAGRFEDARE